MIFRVLSDRATLRYSRSRRGIRDFWQSLKRTFQLFIPNSRGGIITCLLAAAALLYIGNFLYSVYDEIIIIPFEVVGEDASKKDIGASLAESLAMYLEDIHEIFADPNIKGFKRGYSPNYFDPVEDLMATLPIGNIPTAESVSAKLIQPVKIAGLVELPIDKIILKVLPYFHKTTIEGIIIRWDDDITVHISIGGNDPLTVHASNKLGINQLLKRVGSELVEQEHWLAIPEMRTAAKASFSDGLGDYIDYLKTRDPESLRSAEVNYQRAAVLDSSSALVRLHLAVVQYQQAFQSVTDARDSINNFSLILGNDTVKSAAQLGLVAATLRYVERYHPSCYTFNQYMDPMLQKTKLWNDGKGADVARDQLDRRILYGRTLLTLGGRMAEDAGCRVTLEHPPELVDVHKILSHSREIFEDAYTRFVSIQSNRAGEGQNRTDLYLRLVETYTWEYEATAYLASGDKDSARNSLLHSLELASNLLEEKQKLPYWQRRGFAPFLRGAIANDELRLANLEDREDSAHLKDNAVNQLLSALADGSGEVTEWAALRLSDVGFSDGNWKEGLRWLMIGSRSQFSAKNDPLQDQLDTDSLQAGIFFPLPDKVCSVLKRLRVLGEEDIDGVMIPAFLADLLRRTGDLAAAESVLKVAETRFAAPDGTRGPHIAWELAAIKAKVQLARQLNAPRTARTESDIDLPKEPTLNEPRPLQFLFDEYELAILANSSSYAGKFPLPSLNEETGNLATRWEARAPHCDG